MQSDNDVIDRKHNKVSIKARISKGSLDSKTGWPSKNDINTHYINVILKHLKCFHKTKNIFNVKSLQNPFTTTTAIVVSEITWLNLIKSNQGAAIKLLLPIDTSISTR